MHMSKSMTNRLFPNIFQKMLHFPSHINFSSLRKTYFLKIPECLGIILFFLSNLPAIQLAHYVIPAYGSRATTTTTVQLLVKLLDARRSTWKNGKGNKTSVPCVKWGGDPCSGLLGWLEGNLHYTMWLLSKSTGCRLRGPPIPYLSICPFFNTHLHQCYFTNFCL